MFMKTDRVELHALEETDYEALTWTKAVNAGLTTNHLFTGTYPVRAVDIKSVWKKEREAGDVLFGIWVPLDMNDDFHGVPRMVGTCGLHGHRDIYKSWEARWLIFDSNAVGKGIGKEAVTLLTSYAFLRLNAHRVWLGVSADNLRAVKCYLDSGYRFEGRLMDELFYDGVYHDVYRMGVTEETWRSSLLAAAQ